jgi:hypothetical protein
LLGVLVPALSAAVAGDWLPEQLMTGACPALRDLVLSALCDHTLLALHLITECNGGKLNANLPD